MARTLIGIYGNLAEAARRRRNPAAASRLAPNGIGKHGDASFRDR
jgi:hypothetical protein